MCASWLVVFSNGVLFWIARHIFGLAGMWEGPVVQPTIVLSVVSAVAIAVLDDQRSAGARRQRVSVVPFAAAVALGVWAAMSTWWSLEPEATLWRGVVYMFLPFVAWVIADLSFPHFRQTLALAAGALAAGGCLLAAAGGPGAIDANGDWQGFMTNRNGFAPICALLVITGISQAAARMPGPGTLAITIGLIGLVGSGGRTALVGLVVAVAIASIAIGLRRAHLDGRARPVHHLAATATVGGTLVLLGTLLWNQPTFVQRREIWRLVGTHIGDAPLIGSGWGAFWRHPELHDEPLLRLGSAHGSVPDLLLGGGAVALALWLVVCGNAIGGTVRHSFRNPDEEAWLWLSIVLFLALENLTESFVLWFSYNWIVLVAAALRFGPRRETSRASRPSASAVIKLAKIAVARAPRSIASG